MRDLAQRIPHLALRERERNIDAPHDPVELRVETAILVTIEAMVDELVEARSADALPF